MADNEPMSDERLTEIHHWYDNNQGYMGTTGLWVGELLSEVFRLRSERATQQAAIESWYDKWLSRERTQQLLSENAALRLHITNLAEIVDGFDRANVTVIQARAFLADVKDS